MKKVLVILGPTASGKTQLAVNLAHRFNGEIISADSRQIYTGMDIGSGKDLNEYIINGKTINYYLIDILSPLKNYSVFNFKNDFKVSYKKIISKNKLPIVCGGTALYIESIILNYKIPKAKPNNVLRQQFELYSKKKLIETLVSLDKTKYVPKYHISKRRLIRTIEILNNNNSETINMNMQDTNNKNNFIVIGLYVERAELLKKIKSRLEYRLKHGMIEEVESLVQAGMPIERLHYFGLEYRYIGLYLSNQIAYNEMIIKLNQEINKFSKRQMTFFRRMEKRGIKIHWFQNNDLKNINTLVKQSLI